jgi:uncharacterized protein with GYD domain|tara:strand:+ start:821 stop:1147 length:327 start_codon:yes stop_codon:yes gene_type:complete
MARYLIQASYTQQGVAGLVSSPEDRSSVLNSLVEAVGGKVVSLDYCYGEFDVVLIMEAPDDIAMASLSMPVGASGAVTNFHTTVLIPTANGFAAAQKAKEITYRAPGQ